MDNEPDPAHLVHCVASLHALMFLQYTIIHCLLVLGSLTPLLLSYHCIMLSFTVNVYVETPLPCNHLLQLWT